MAIEGVQDERHPLANQRAGFWVDLNLGSIRYLFDTDNYLHCYTLSDKKFGNRVASCLSVFFIRLLSSISYVLKGLQRALFIIRPYIKHDAFSCQEKFFTYF